jgi:hypothetical protein
MCRLKFCKSLIINGAGGRNRNRYLKLFFGHFCMAKNIEKKQTKTSFRAF